VPVALGEQAQPERLPALLRIGDAQADAEQDRHRRLQDQPELTFAGQVLREVLPEAVIMHRPLDVRAVRTRQPHEPP
jgi:hypothetical protein